MAAAARTSRNAGREEGPQWARRFPDTPEGMDATMVHREARQLPDDTDPDTIEDPDVRDAFLERLQADENDDDDNGGRDTGRGRAASSDPARRRGRGRPRRYAPTLTAPSRFSTADGTGFALGLILYALGINGLRYGWPGVTGWISAKFINKPPDPPLTSSSSSSGTAAGGRRKFDFGGRGSFGGKW